MDSKTTWVIVSLVVSMLWIISVPIASAAADTGKIVGTVKDRVTAKPLPGANVILKGTWLGAAADGKGRYVIQKVPVGSYTLVATMMGYASQIVDNVQVKPGGEITVDFHLEPTVLEMDAIVVTATKTNIPLKDAPASVSVISQQEIAWRNPKGVDEVVNLVPGVYDKRTKGILDIMPSVNIRGIYGTDRNLILVDGMPTMEGCWRHVPVELVERVEVVKGPFSALYGENAMGGVVNIITKIPRRKFELTLKSNVERHNTQVYQIIGGGQYKSFDYLFSILNRKTDGYVSYYSTVKAKSGSATTRVTGWERTTDAYGNPKYIVGDVGKNWYKDQAYNFKIGWQVLENTRIGLAYSHTNYDYGYKNGKSYLRDPDGDVVTSGTFRIVDSGDTLKLSVKDSYFNSSYGGNPTNTLNISLNTHSGKLKLFAYAGTDWEKYWWASPSGYAYKTPSQNRYGEIQASLRLLKNYLLTAGLGYRAFQTESNKWALQNWEDVNSETTLLEQVRGNTGTLGIYLQNEFEIKGLATLYLGGRYDRWSSSDGKFKKWNKKESKYEITFYDERTRGCFSPKAALVLRPLSGTSLRGSIGKAFRGPTIHNLYKSWGYGSYVRLANPDLSPETVLSWDVGVDQVVMNRFLFRASYFSNKMNDLIYKKRFTPEEVNAYNQAHGTSYSTITQMQNVAQAKSQGVELSLRGKVLLGLTGFANFTFVDAKIVKNPAKPATEGKKLTYIPQKTQSFGLAYSSEKLRASIIGRYVDKIYMSDTNIDTTTGVFGGYDSFFVVDAKVSYAFSVAGFSPRIALTVDNLFNKKYYQYYESPGRIWGIHLSLMKSY